MVLEKIFRKIDLPEKSRPEKVSSGNTAIRKNGFLINGSGKVDSGFWDSGIVVGAELKMQKNRRSSIHMKQR
jgi:hypothetical protein